MSVWRGPGGNREVPPTVILGGAEANLEEEGGSSGKHGFTHGSEPEASDGHALGVYFDGHFVTSVSRFATKTPLR